MILCQGQFVKSEFFRPYPEDRPAATSPFAPARNPLFPPSEPSHRPYDRRIIRAMPETRDEMLEAYEVPLLGYFTALVGRAVAAEELLVQTVEAADILGGCALRGRALRGLSPRARIFGIARELAIDHIRLWPEHAGDPLDSTGRNPIRAAFAEIPLPEREVVCLKLFGGISVPEIATILGIDEGRALAWLRSGFLAVAHRMPSRVEEHSDGLS